MARVIAIIILVGGLAAIGWVALSADDETASTTAVAASTGATTGAAATSTTAVTPTPTTFQEPDNYGPRMDLVDIDGWLQTDATSIDEFDGQVLLVEMWTFGCFNCKARIPHNQSYYEEFGDDNFEILGVHAPEFSYEAELANIEEALERLDVTWPQALDMEKKNFRAWQPGTTNYWPRTYVIDQNGDIRYDHIGEGRYDELRETIRYLLENPPEPRPET